MASPQAENGYTKIANEIMEVLVKTHLRPAEWRIILFLLRKTWGWGKKDDAISLSQFARGCDMKRQNAHRALKRLIDQNIIKKTVINTDYRCGLRYSFNKNYEQWKLSSYVMTDKRVKIRETIKESVFAKNTDRSFFYY